MDEKVCCINDINLLRKRVLLRADYNLPLNAARQIKDYLRVEASLKTIRYILDAGAKCIVIISHMGRPKGNYVKELSLEPVARILENLLKRKVIFLTGLIGDSVINFCNNPPEGSVILLENLRFHLEETGTGVNSNLEPIVASKEDILAFERKLRKLGDVFVNDAFGTCHRSHTSMIMKSFEVRVAGFLVKSELKYFSRAFHLNDAHRPFLAIIAGNKVPDKLPTLESILDEADDVIIAGGMAYDFLRVTRGMKTGSTKIHPDTYNTVRKLTQKAEANGVNLHFPVDFIISDEFSENGRIYHTDVETGISDNCFGVDMGPKSIEMLTAIIHDAKTIIWNGPVGVVRFSRFYTGTRSFLKAVVEATANGALSILGGGRTASFALKFYKREDFTHISTGGGALLKLLESRTLVAVDSLNRKPENGKKPNLGQLQNGSVPEWKLHKISG